MKDPARGDWVLPLNGFQNGDGEKGKRVLRFSRVCPLLLVILTQRKYFSQEIVEIVLL